MWRATLNMPTNSSSADGSGVVPQSGARVPPMRSDDDGCAARLASSGPALCHAVTRAAQEKRLVDLIRRTQVFPELGWEVVEGEERIAILDEAFGRFLVFDAPSLDEGIERPKRILLGFRHPDLLQRALGFRLLALRQLVQHVGGLVHPAALAAGLRPYFLDRLPEAERAVGDREIGRHRKSAPLQVEQQLLPGLRTLAQAVDQTDQLLLALGRGADDNQQALRGVLEPSLYMDAIGPEVYVALG
jgi:hypothetical protein